MWDVLLGLKHFRARQAQQRLVQARAAWAASRRQLDEAQATARRHAEQAQARERADYAALVDQGQVRRRDLEDVLARVAQSRAHQIELDDRVRRSEVAAEAAEHQVAQDRSAHQQAERVREKFELLARTHGEEATLQAERAAESELDELAAQRRERDEWGHDDGH